MRRRNPPKKKKENVLNEAILNLEKVRGSKVVVYITGDKNPEQIFNTQIASDILPYFKNVLKGIGNVRKITLALYTNGGQLETPWPLVNSIRENCEEFEVVVLSKALSAGTLISIGADRIVMDKYTYLSPIDPAANIQDGNKQVKHFEIEDIIGYIDFVKEKIGITEQNSLCEIMKDLTREINPTMLGSANRTHSLVRRLARNLLSEHKSHIEERDIKDIIEHLTEKLFSHRHLISRNEAREIGFGNIIEFPDIKSSKAIDNLLKVYINYLELEKEFDPIDIIGGEEKKEILVNRAVIHSEKIGYSLQSTCAITKIPDPSAEQKIKVNLIKSKWIKK
jgi:ATP-dependent protease ClpP protease subunit